MHTLTFQSPIVQIPTLVLDSNEHAPIGMDFDWISSHESSQVRVVFQFTYVHSKRSWNLLPPCLCTTHAQGVHILLPIAIHF